ncbi:MAG: lysophospholipid acyltransferase family protein [Verrucomicrobia bacterium]|nr:lysophospholipid acyltransferase family protein [Verrucomicrobiota bacterium]
MNWNRFRSALHLIAYGFYRAALEMFRLIPVTLVFITGLCLGALCFAVLGKRRRLAVSNIMMALGKGRRFALGLAFRHFALLGANVLCTAKVYTMRDAALRRRTTISIAPEIPEEPGSSGWVAMLSHSGNWELLARLAAFFPQYRYGAVYQPLANSLVDRHFRKVRAAAGISLFNRREGFWQPLAFLESGGVLGILCDQNAGLSGTPMPFFGKTASTSILASTLALHADTPVVSISVTTAGLARWHVSVGHPIPKGSSPAEMTAFINLRLEQQILDSPADWLWSHNRWKLPVS